MKKFYITLLIFVIGLVAAIAVTAFNNPSGNPPTGNGALTVDSGLNVGIGKNPSYKLDVNGIINGTALYVGGAPYVGSQWTTTGSNIYYNTGNVGIGNTDPGSYKLKVTGTTQTSGFQLGTTATAGYVLTTDASGVGTWQAISALPSGASGQTLRHNGTTWVANSVIYNDGTNVGIGTTNPSHELDLGPGTSGHALSFSDYVILGAAYSSGATLLGNMVMPVSGSSGYAKSTGITIAQAAIEMKTGVINFATKASDASAKGTVWNMAANTKMTITNAGNVGIGTASPGSNKLAIAGGNLDLGGSNITGVNKLTVTSIDPVFQINGRQYVTYVPDTIGQKVELVGQAQLTNGEWSIDLSGQKENSDLWLFYQIVKPETIIPLVSSQSSASLYAYMDGANLVVKLKDGDPQAKFSYQLTASRIDQKTDYITPETDSSVYIDVDSLKK